ncbi:MAG: ribosome-associated translation inhibitor RaiA [Clostridia bacterium]|nr:ribosome-associated translation inhibitor RaiA [Clostridia bacterium]MBP5372943.1 ribosome-associated translation inhibitor RaiA [Clostridia bacterium]
MKIEIVTKNYRVSDELNEVLSKKISKLDKYFEDDAKCRVYLKKVKRDAKMEISLLHKGLDIRAEGKGENFYDIIDLVLPKLERQIYKHRSKLEDKLKKSAFSGDKLFALAEDDEFALVKTKQFEVTPCTIDEAIEQFELSGYGFFVFYDIEADKTKVLYLREDGNVGLIDPIVKQ